MNRLYYKDGMGRPVFVWIAMVEDGERTLVAFKDASDQHQGHSITNSIERAIVAFNQQFPKLKNTLFFETYDGESYDMITLIGGVPKWMPVERDTLAKLPSVMV